MFHLCEIEQLGMSVSQLTHCSKNNYCLLWLWPVSPRLVRSLDWLFFLGFAPRSTVRRRRGGANECLLPQGC